jgi:putative DNA primase/helicase
MQPKRQDTGWQAVPNLWGAIVGRPGAMKSPATGQVLAMLDRLESNEREVWQSAYNAWETEARLAKMSDAANEKKAAGLVSNGKAGEARALLAKAEVDAEPIQRRFIVNDTTYEKLGEILLSDSWGTLSYRDELQGLLASLDKQGQEGARSFYLQAYDGDKGYTFDRIGRGTLRLDRVCLAMLGGIQPGRLQDYVRSAVSGGGGDDGLLQRFSLVVWPDQSKEFVNVDEWPDSEAKATAWEVFNRLSKLDPIEGSPVVWRFDDAAQELFNDWRVKLETNLRTGELHAALESHLAKYRKLVPALALIFALIDMPESTQVIGKRELMRAMAWAEYLRSHAERVYSAAVTPESNGAHTLIAKIKQGKLTDGIYRLAEFAPRQVAVKGWAGLGSSEAVRKACELLCEYGWLRVASAEVNPLGGRPSGTYEIHPDLCGMMK